MTKNISPIPFIKRGTDHPGKIEIDKQTGEIRLSFKL
jgi:hypothetical protein